MEQEPKNVYPLWGRGGIETDGSSSNMMIEFENNARESEKERERERKRGGGG